MLNYGLVKDRIQTRDFTLFAVGFKLRLNTQEGLLLGVLAEFHSTSLTTYYSSPKKAVHFNLKTSIRMTPNSVYR
jgi:hypothetical protein